MGQDEYEEKKIVSPSLKVPAITSSGLGGGVGRSSDGDGGVCGSS